MNRRQKPRKNRPNKDKWDLAEEKRASRQQLTKILEPEDIDPRSYNTLRRS